MRFIPVGLSRRGRRTRSKNGELILRRGGGGGRVVNAGNQQPVGYSRRPAGCSAGWLPGWPAVSRRYRRPFLYPALAALSSHPRTCFARSARPLQSRM